MVARCDHIEEAYEFMLAYAAQGLASDAGELWDVLGRLPEDQRIVVVLKYYGGYRASEIASIVDMPGATVRSHLRRGLKALREELDS